MRKKKWGRSEWIWGFGKAIIKDCWEKGRKRPQGVSEHFVHHAFNQIYIQGHGCVTGRPVLLQSAGDRQCKEFWEQSVWEEHPQGCVATDLSTKAFPVRPVVFPSSVRKATLSYVTQLVAWAGTWGSRLRGTVQSEKCPCFVVISPKLRSSLYNRNYSQRGMNPVKHVSIR